MKFRAIIFVLLYFTSGISCQQSSKSKLRVNTQVNETIEKATAEPEKIIIQGESEKIFVEVPVDAFSEPVDVKIEEQITEANEDTGPIIIAEIKSFSKETGAVVDDKALLKALSAEIIWPGTCEKEKLEISYSDVSGGTFVNYEEPFDVKEEDAQCVVRISVLKANIKIRLREQPAETISTDSETAPVEYKSENITVRLADSNALQINSPSVSKLSENQTNELGPNALTGLDLDFISTNDASIAATLNYEVSFASIKVNNKENLKALVVDSETDTQTLISKESLTIIENPEGTINISFTTDLPKGQIILLEENSANLNINNGIVTNEDAELRFPNNSPDEFHSIEVETLAKVDAESLNPNAVESIQLQVKDSLGNIVESETEFQVSFPDTTFTNQSLVSVEIFEDATKTETIENSELVFSDNGDGTFKVTFSTSNTDATFILVENPPTQYSLSGTTTGYVSGILALQLNASETININSNGVFSFTTTLLQGASFNITIQSHPSDYFCDLSNASGTIGSENISNISVSCSPLFSLGGNVSGATGSFVIEINGGDALAIDSNGMYSFPQKLQEGVSYTISFDSFPTGQGCALSNNSGTMGGSDITNIDIVCASDFSVGGTVSGYSTGTLVLTNNDGDDETISANGSYSFNTNLNSGNSYSVAVKTHPNGYGCTVTNSTGTIVGTNINNIDITCNALVTHTVGALYSNGSNWNDYVDNDGSDVFSASNSACNPDHSGAYSDCVHGGEIREVTLSGINDCTGLTAVDNENLFDWTCLPGSPIKFVSSFKTNSRLSDLIDWTQSPPEWKENSVLIKNGDLPIANSTSAVWWTNSIVENNAGGNLGVYGAIYVITSATPSAGYLIGQNNIAVVADPAITATITGGAVEYIIYAIGKDFLWIEGEFVGPNFNYGLYWDGVRQSKVNSLEISGSDVYCMSIENSKSLLLHGVIVGTCDGAGAIGIALQGTSTQIAMNIISVTDTNDNSFSSQVPNVQVDGMLISNSGGVGLYTSGNGDNNSFQNVVIDTTTEAGIFLSGDTNTLSDSTITGAGFAGINIDGNAPVLRNVDVSNSGQSGIYLDGDPGTAHNAKLINVSSHKNGSHGIQTYRTNNVYIHQAMVASNGAYGISVDQGIGHRIFQVTSVFNTNLGISTDSNADEVLIVGATSAYNAGFAGISIFDDSIISNSISYGNNTNGIYTASGANNRYSNLAIYGNNNAFSFSVDNGNYMLDTIKLGNNTAACSGTAQTNMTSSCAQQGISTHTLITGITAIPSSYVGNITSDDTSNDSDTSGKDSGTITDWFDFINPFRAWGVADTLTEGACVDTSAPNECQIWDWSLLDNVDTASQNFLPGNEDFFTVNSVQTLKNAIEIYGDSVGDDDGYCENGEDCLFLNHFGSYQGDESSGLVLRATLPASGTMQSIRLFEYDNLH